jgi:hypothetical protein
MLADASLESKEEQLETQGAHSRASKHLAPIKAEIAVVNQLYQATRGANAHIDTLLQHLYLVVQPVATCERN